MSFAVVLVGGTIPDKRLLDGADQAEVIIAADGGVRIARTHGLPIHFVVGDLDSASDGDLAWARAEGADVLEHPADKDATDLELALERAEHTGVDRIVAVGVDGGRLDHELGNWATLCGQRSARVDVHTMAGWATVLHADTHASINLTGEPGDLVSLLPRFGDAGGVSTTGLRWELDAETLYKASTRGVSNEFLREEVSVRIDSGALMVIRPTICALDH